MERGAPLRRPERKNRTKKGFLKIPEYVLNPDTPYTSYLFKDFNYFPFSDILNIQ
jgi:hypothetical protein